MGAGTGTVCFGWKGGIGKVPGCSPGVWGYTVGALVLTNFGGILDIAGVPVGKELGQYSYRQETADGSCMIVIATDAPLDARQLARVAKGQRWRWEERARPCPTEAETTLLLSQRSSRGMILFGGS